MATVVCLFVCLFVCVDEAPTPPATATTTTTTTTAATTNRYVAALPDKSAQEESLDPSTLRLCNTFRHFRPYLYTCNESHHHSSKAPYHHCRGARSVRSLSRNQLRAHLTQLRLPCQDSIPGAQLYSASQVCRSGHRGGSACWGECMPRYNACRRQRSTSRHACSPRRQRVLVAGPQQTTTPTGA